LPLRVKVNIPFAQGQHTFCSMQTYRVHCAFLSKLGWFGANNRPSRRSQQQQKQGQAVAINVGQTALFSIEYWTLHRIEVNTAA